MGDSDTCDIKETGSVKIATHDEMIRKLTNVRYVPELKCNLISLGELDRPGYVFKYENELLKVNKGSLIKLKGTLRNGLYVLEDTAVSGSVAKTSEQQKQQTVDHVVIEVKIDSGVQLSGKSSNVSIEQSPLVSQTKATDESEFDDVQSQ